MKNKIKRYLNLAINGFILKPFGLMLSHSVGRNPLEDMKRLFDGADVKQIIDGGAYRGDFSLEVAKIFPGAMIYAFEPQETSFSLLSQNTSSIGNIKPINCALGDASGTAYFYTNKSPLTSSLSKSSNDALRYFDSYNNPEGVEEVKVVSLSDYFLDKAILGIDILKLDLQGHELQAIHGLGDMLKMVKLIYIEVEFIKLYEDASLFSDVESFLRERSFVFFQLYGQVRSPENGRLLYSDAIFLNSEYFSL